MPKSYGNSTFTRITQELLNPIKRIYENTSKYDENDDNKMVMAQTQDYESQQDSPKIM